MTFRELENLAQDVCLSLNLNKCEVKYCDHTTLGSLLVNIPGIIELNPELSTHLGSPIGGVQAIDSILGKKIDSLHILG